MTTTKGAVTAKSVIAAALAAGLMAANAEAAIRPAGAHDLATHHKHHRRHHRGLPPGFTGVACFADPDGNLICIPQHV